MNTIKIYDGIIESYIKTGSVQKTAKEMQVSIIKVRRVLITEGLWSSATSQAIRELRNQGLNTEQIAEQLHYTVKNVEAYSPYSRGVYGAGEQSECSLRSKKYRERRQTAADNTKKASRNNPKKYVYEDNLDKVQHKHPIALKLHLELDLDECSEQDMDVLRKFGKVDKTISRDVIVPADITLHALHYVIQKLFGWQNSHLHHFEFPETVFDKLTEDSFLKWCSLAGVYFRFPDEEIDDLFWDDDYEPNVSFKSWLKSKYKGPYLYGGIGDYYYENQCRVQELKQQLPVFQVRPSFEEFLQLNGKEPEERIVSLANASIKEFKNSIDLGGDLTHLLERLNLKDYLFLPKNNYFLDSIDDKIAFLEDGLEENLKTWRKYRMNVDAYYDNFCQCVTVSTVRMQAQSNQLFYYYDYGDGWKVSIDLTEDFYEEDLDGEYGHFIRSVLETYSPVCIQADGLPVLDDVGGVGGYIDFLRTIHLSRSERKREEMCEWAGSLGWTGRITQPKNFL